MKKEEMAKNVLVLKGEGGADVTYPLKDLDFINVMCDLEDKGIPIYAMATSNTLNGARAMNTIRTMFAVMIDEQDEKKAGTILSTHLKNGGNVDDVMNAFGDLMGGGGFGSSPETAEEAPAAE